MEGPDEVLSLREVDGGLAADRRVDLRDERGRHRHPGHTAEVRRRREAGEVERGAAADGDDRPAPVEPQGGPEPCRVRDRLGRLARGNLVRAREPVAQGRPDAIAVDRRDGGIDHERERTAAGHELCQTRDRAFLDMDPGRGEHRAVRVSRASVRDLVVERRALLEQRSELRLRRERAADRCRRRASRLRPPTCRAAGRRRAPRVRSRVALDARAPPPSSTTARLRRPRSSAAACASSSRKAGSPRSEKSSGTVLPVCASTCASTDTNSRPSRAASSGPRVDLPAPMKPTSARWRSSAFSAASGCAPGTRRAPRRSP